MKLSNLILMPLALTADAVTLGMAGMTSDLMDKDDAEQAVDAFVEIMKARGE